MNTPRLPLRATLLALAILLFAACETGPDRKALMDEVRHSVPPMAADDKFFDGQIICRLSLASNVGGAAIFGGHESGGASSKMTAFKGNEGENNFGGGGSMSGGGSGMGGGMAAAPEMETNTSDESRRKAAKGGTYQGNQGMSHISDENDAESPAARRAREAQMPPALLRLRLENTGGATLVIEIRDVNSELGNFAIRPDTVTLDAGQSIEVDPMQSMLGVESYALPVTVTLRAAGQTQTKVLTLRPIAQTPAATSPAQK